MKHCIRPFLLLFLLLVFVVSKSFGQSIAITPPTLSFALKPGESATQNVRITNGASRPYSFEAYIGEWVRDTLGAHHYYKPGTLDSISCADWVTFSPSFFELKPQETIELAVTVQAPLDEALFKRMRWAMLFIETKNEQTMPVDAKGRAIGITQRYRMGVHIYQTPPNIKDASAKAIELKEDKAKKVLEFLVENTGHTQLQECKAKLEITDVESGKSWKVEEKPFPMFPAGVRKVVFGIPDDLPKGKQYSMLAVLDYGDNYPLEAIEQNLDWK